MKYTLSELIDIKRIQSLLDRLYEITDCPLALIDNDGNILTATGWQDVCTKFHRQNKESEQECIKSNQCILGHIHQTNPAVSYRCPHGLMDYATPIIVNGEHLGNFFIGQFFLEEPNQDFFRNQAKKYSFNEEAYLEAVRKVPIWTQEKLNRFLFFINSLIEFITDISLKNLNEIENRKKQEDNKEQHRTILQTAMDGFWLLDTQGSILEVNDAYCRMSGYSMQELLTMRISDLEAIETADDIDNRNQKIKVQHEDRFESRHRRKDGRIFDVEISVQFRSTEGGQFVVFLRDITQRTQREKRISLLSQMLNAAPASITIHDTKGQFLFANSITSILHGYDNNEEFLSINLHDLDVPASETLLNERFRLIDEKGEVRFEVAHYRKDGSTLPMEVHAKSIEWDGQPAVLSIATDITERKKAEAALQESETKYRELVENANSIILRMDTSGNVTFFNEFAENFFGYKKEEIIGQNVMGSIVPERDSDGRDMSNFISDLIHFPEKYTRNENENQRKDGSRIWIRWTNKVVINDAGIPSEILCIGTDITERKQAEDALRRIQARQHAMIANISDVIGIMGHDGIMKYKSPNIKEWFGWDPEDLVGTDGWETVYPDDREWLQKEFAFLLTVDKSSTKVEYRYKCKDGHYTWIELMAVNLIHDPDIDGVLMNYHDITERKQAENFLREERQRLNNILEGTDAGTWEWNVQTGETTFNKRWAQIIGYTLDEISPGIH